MNPHLLIAIVFLAVVQRGWSGSILELPSHIKPPDSGLALIADFSHPAGGTIPVYLINRSGKELWLASQDGDIYLKLEYQTSNGSWQRAQPQVYSFCGNSYDFRPGLRPDHFIMLGGYQPSRGDSARIRFRLYDQRVELSSNAGQGLVQSEDIQKARKDGMAAKADNFDFVESVARGKQTLEHPMGREEGRLDAIRRLAGGRYDFVKAEAVLREIAALKEEPYAQVAQDALKMLKTYRAEHTQ